MTQVQQPTAYPAPERPPVVGVFTLREVLLAVVGVIILALSFVSITPLTYAPVWVLPAQLVLTTLFPLSAIVLVLVRRLWNPSLRVASFGVDQLAAIAAFGALVGWVDTLAWAAHPALPWLGLLFAAAFTVLTVLAPFIPGLRADFQQRPEVSAEAFASGARVLPRQPRPLPQQAPAFGSGFANAPAPGHQATSAPFGEPRYTGGHTAPFAPVRHPLSEPPVAPADPTGGWQAGAAARAVSQPLAGAPAEMIASPEPEPEPAPAHALAEPALHADTPDAVDAPAAAASIDQLAQPGGDEDHDEWAPKPSSDAANAASNPSVRVPTPVESAELSDAQLFVFTDATLERDELPVADAGDRSPADDVPAGEPQQDTATGDDALHDAEAEHPARSAAAEPFWALAPEPRLTVDEAGTPVFEVGPVAWVLVVEDRGDAYLVRNHDGRLGLLTDVTGVIRN